MTGSRFDLPRAQIRYAPWRGRRGSSTREGVGVIGAERLAMGGGVLVTAALVAIGTPHMASAVGVPRPQGMPDWRSSRMWRLGVLQSAASMV